MNYSCYNHKLNSIDQNNLQNYVLSDRTTAQFNSIHEVQQSKLKTKAYINPHVFNYEYIKKSLSQGSFSTTNKIHFNPYFKNNGSNSFKKDEDRMLPLRSTEFASRSWGIKKENNPTSKVLSENKKMHFVKLASKYKLINKKDLMHNQQPHQSKYSWSKERLINESSFCNKLSKTSLKKGPANLNKEHAVLNKKSDNLTPANQFRINTSRNLSKISNLTCKALEKKPPPIYLTKMKIINLSSKKLVNSYASTIKPNLKLSSNKIWSNQAKFCYNKTKCLIKVASLVRNKYKYYRGANSQKGSKYKLDKRKKLSVNLSKKPSLIETNDIGKLFPNPHKTKYFYLKPQPSRFFKKKNSASWSWRKPEAPSSIISNKANHYPNKKIIKIGGILYKSTSNKLTIAKNNKKEKAEEEIKKLNIKRKKLKKNHFVYVRGEKFLLDKNGKTLIRQSSNVENKSSLVFKRIDIGGVTYLEKSQNVLIRTNVHQARSIVNYAKQKSIATLCQLRKRSALPCMIYHKFGKCIRHSKGLCMYKHDPKNIAICKRFLRGNCTNSDCLLSHEVIMEKMATCHFFLNGCCSRENCPFLHVKLNKNADICENFLRGFCDSGQNCSKRHLFQCPEYDKHGKCNLGSKCLYPHKAKQTTECEELKNLAEGNETVQYNTKKFHTIPKSNGTKCKRPFLSFKNCQGQNDPKKMKKCKRKSSLSSTNSDQVGDFIPKRIKLDKLPSFIPLTETK